MPSFADYQSSTLAPGWLRESWGGKFLRALGERKDAHVALLKEAVKCRFPLGTRQRTNLLTYSQQLDHANWSKATATIAANAIAAPDGTTTADKIIASVGGGGSAVHGVYQTKALTEGETYTASAYAKKADTPRVFIVLAGNAYAVNQLVRFDLDEGTATVEAGAPRCGMEAVGDGWYRIWASAPAQATDTGSPHFQVSDASGARIFVGDGVSGNYAWQLQFELGSVPTNDIVTTSVAVTVFDGAGPADAIALLALERGIPRGKNESEASHRARLRTAWDTWRWAGTPYGMLLALYWAGYRPSSGKVLLQVQKGWQYELRDDFDPAVHTAEDALVVTNIGAVSLGGSPQLWSQFAVFFVNPLPPTWNPPPADGSTEVDDIRSLILRWKPGHAQCVALKVIPGVTWGMGGLTWGSFTWGAGDANTVWTPPVG